MQGPTGSGSTTMSTSYSFWSFTWSRRQEGERGAETVHLSHKKVPIKKDPDQTGTQRRAPQDPDPQDCQQAILSDHSPGQDDRRERLAETYIYNIKSTYRMDPDPTSTSTK
jgi:hypothetical protein